MYIHTYTTANSDQSGLTHNYVNGTGWTTFFTTHELIRPTFLCCAIQRIGQTTHWMELTRAKNKITVYLVSLLKNVLVSILTFRSIYKEELSGKIYYIRGKHSCPLRKSE